MTALALASSALNGFENRVMPRTQRYAALFVERIALVKRDRLYVVRMEITSAFAEDCEETFTVAGAYALAGLSPSG